MASLIATLATAGIVAATTIGTNISTSGTLSVSSNVISDLTMLAGKGLVLGVNPI